VGHTTKNLTKLIIFSLAMPSEEEKIENKFVWPDLQLLPIIGNRHKDFTDPMLTSRDIRRTNHLLGV
jgi:hypothetical protein